MAAVQRTPVAQLRVLAVDDQLVDRKLLSRMLADEGYENYSVVASGADALAALRDAEALHPFKVCLVDINMPGMSGFELLAAIRARYGSQLTVVMLSGDDDDSTVESALAQDADSFLSKPLRAHEVRLIWQYAYQRELEDHRIAAEAAKVTDLGRQIVDLEVEVKRLKRERDGREQRRDNLIHERQRRSVQSSLAEATDSGVNNAPAEVITPGGTRRLLRCTDFCMICEEVVPSDMMAEHTEVCRTVTVALMAAANGQEALQQVLGAVEKGIQGAMQLSLHEAMAQFELQAEPLRRLEALALQAAAEDSDPEATRLLARQARLIEVAARAERQPDVVRTARLTVQAIEKLRETSDLIEVAGQHDEQAVSQLQQRRLRQLTSFHQRRGSRGSMSSDSSGSDSPLRPGSPELPLPARARAKSIDDFHVVKALARGAYGTVYLAQKKTTGGTYAIKVLPLQRALRSHHAAKSVMFERSILSLSAECPFLTQLFYSFRSEESVFLVMPYLRGGDLATLLGNVGVLDEGVARFYAACVLCGLEFLHARGIVHRDVKPDNMLVGNDGFGQLTDFGLAAQDGEHAERRVAGTPGYMAPEIYGGAKVTTASDMWSLGCVLYEMLFGQPPHLAHTIEEVERLTVDASVRPSFPPQGCSDDARDLITRLLERDAARRPTAAEVKQHPFFSTLDWDDQDSWGVPFTPSETESYHQGVEDAEMATILSRSPSGRLQEVMRVAHGSSASLELDVPDPDSPLANFELTNLAALTRANLDGRSPSGTRSRGGSSPPAISSSSGNTSHRMSPDL